MLRLVSCIHNKKKEGKREKKLFNMQFEVEILLSEIELGRLFICGRARRIEIFLLFHMICGARLPGNLTEREKIRNVHKYEYIYVHLYIKRESSILCRARNSEFCAK